jgi:hypothetical protein
MICAVNELVIQDIATVNGVKSFLRIVPWLLVNASILGFWVIAKHENDLDLLVAATLFGLPPVSTTPERD